MVFCHECKQQVEDCPHCVYPIQAPRVEVFDPKIETPAYAKEERILEIAFKSGQVWQLAGVPPNIYAELSESTISSFLTFIARRYKASPVKRGSAAVRVPETDKCAQCGSAMIVDKRVNGGFDPWVRIFWKCTKCAHTHRREYGKIEGERRARHR